MTRPALERRYRPQVASNPLSFAPRASASSGRGSVRSFRATLSTPSLLADGKSILASAWDLGSFHARGGPLLHEHGTTGSPPLGFVSNVHAEAGRLVGTVHLLPRGISPLADTFAELHAMGGRPNLSVGFRTRSERGPSHEEARQGPGWPSARIVERADLTEVSVVAVGMDPAAGLEAPLLSPPRSTKPDPLKAIYDVLFDDEKLAALCGFPLAKSAR